MEDHLKCDGATREIGKWIVKNLSPLDDELAIGSRTCDIPIDIVRIRGEDGLQVIPEWGNNGTAVEPRYRQSQSDVERPIEGDNAVIRNVDRAEGLPPEMYWERKSNDRGVLIFKRQVGSGNGDIVGWGSAEIVRFQYIYRHHVTVGKTQGILSRLRGRPGGRIDPVVCGNVGCVPVVHQLDQSAARLHRNCDIAGWLRAINVQCAHQNRRVCSRCDKVTARLLAGQNRLIRASHGAIHIQALLRHCPREIGIGIAAGQE